MNIMKETNIISAEFVNGSVITKSVVNGKIHRESYLMELFSSNIDLLTFLKDHPKKTLRSSRTLPSSEFKLDNLVISGTDILGNWFVTEDIRSFRLIGNGVQVLSFSVHDDQWLSRELYFKDNEYRDIFIQRLLNAHVPENNPRFSNDYLRHLK